MVDKLTDKAMNVGPVVGSDAAAKQTWTQNPTFMDVSELYAIEVPEGRLDSE